MTPDPNDPARVIGLSVSGRRLLASAAGAITARRLDEADHAFAGLLALAPRHPEVLRLLGVLRMLQKRPADAVEVLSRAAGMRTDDALIHLNLGSALRAFGRPDEAITELREAVRLAPSFAGAWFNLGRALKSQAHIEEADAALGTALANAPDHAEARLARAETRKALGRITDAEADYRGVLARRPASAEAWHGLANLKTVAFDAAETRRLRDALAAATSSDARVMLGFALAKALEDQGDFADAFATLVTANTAKRRTIEWDRDAFSAMIDASLAADREAAPPDVTNARGSEIVFVISLPRSGSTLVEQILGAHPEVEGAGELQHLPDIIEDECSRRGRPLEQWLAAASRDDWNRLGGEYLARTARWRTSRPRSTDKGLNNWFHVVAARRMLPGATFVWCRRDPLETVFGCFRHLFALGQRFAYDLDDLVAYRRDYDRTLAHLLDVAGSRTHRVTYEELVASPEACIRALLDACALPFDEACLRFHESSRSVRTASAAQVRQPMRVDTARAPRFGSVLDGIRDRLALPDQATDG